MFLLVLSAFFYLLHVFCESLSTFTKYNYVALGRHMRGISISNIIAVLSRVFISVFGLLAAVLIEKNIVTLQEYSITFFVTLLIASSISYGFSKIQILHDIACSNRATHEIFGLHISKTLSSEFLATNQFRLNIFISLFIATQFVAIVIAYEYCIIYSHNRLAIISMIPVIGMIGTLISVGFVEPRYAKTIDSNNASAYGASSAFLKARSVSFLISSIFIILVPASI